MQQRDDRNFRCCETFQIFLSVTTTYLDAMFIEVHNGPNIRVGASGDGCVRQKQWQNMVLYGRRSDFVPSFALQVVLMQSEYGSEANVIVADL